MLYLCRKIMVHVQEKWNVPHNWHQKPPVEHVPKLTDCKYMLHLNTKEMVHPDNTYWSKLLEPYGQHFEGGAYLHANIGVYSCDSSMHDRISE